VADIPILSKILEGARWWGDEVVDDKMLGQGLRMANQGMRAIDRAPLPFQPPGGLGSAIVKAGPLGGIMDLMLPNQADASLANVQRRGGKDWVDVAYKNSPWQHFFAGAALDPLNLVGMGVPGKLATAAPAGGKLASALKVADILDRAPGVVANKSMDALSSVGRGALQGAADVVGPMVPSSPALDAFGNAVGKTMQGWREQALTSGGYHVNNWLGNVALAGQAGQWDVAKAAALAPFTGRGGARVVKTTTAPGVQNVKVGEDLLNKIGNHRQPLNYATPPPPIDPASFTSRWNEQMAKINRPGNINNVTPERSVYRDIPDSPLNPLRDKAAGIFEANKRFGTERVEGPAVDAAFNKTFRPAFNQNASEFYKELQHVRDPMTGRRPPEVQQAVAAFKKAQGQMSPDDLREILQPGTRARRVSNAAMPQNTNQMVGGAPVGVSGRPPVQPSYLDGLVENWENRIIDSLEAGTKNSTDIFFDYSANNPVDKLGRNAFAFHRFAVNNIPKGIRASGERPINAMIPSEYYRASDKYNEQQGLPGPTWHGKMPIGGQIPGVGQFNFDPVGVLPFGALVKAATRPHSQNDDDGSWLGQLADDFQGVGLGLNPFIEAALTATGQHGQGFAPGFLRASQPVNGILSSVLDRPVDIEGAQKGLLGSVQEGLGQGRPFPYQEYLLKKRQAELKANGEDPTKAGALLGDQMAVEGVGGFAGVPGLKLLTPEEQNIRHDNRLAQAYKLAGNLAGYRANPAAGAYADLYPEDQQIANWGNLSAAEREQLFRDPKVRDKLLAQLAMQLHNTGGKALSPNPLISKGLAAQKAGRVAFSPAVNQALSRRSMADSVDPGRKR
jgi:hypothetical protein